MDKAALGLNSLTLEMEKTVKIAPRADEVLANLLDALPELTLHHSPGGKVYTALSLTARHIVSSLFSDQNPVGVPLSSFGTIIFPYHSMGAVDSLDLFGLDELILFSFYRLNCHRYRKVADIGANIGLHSLIMARCGFIVQSYEPDPEHLTLFRENMQANQVSSVKVIEAAVSAQTGEAEFLRLRGNTTGSHIAGAKNNPYGEIDRFKVQLASFSEVAEHVDFAKIDAEGHEAVIVASLSATQWDTIDVMLEIGTEANAVAIFDYATCVKVNIFTQKNGWNLARGVTDLPTSYKQGSAFMTRKTSMPWTS